MYAPLDGRCVALVARVAGPLAGSFALLDVWLSAELCKIRNPPAHRLGGQAQSRTLGRAIFFREI